MPKPKLSRDARTLAADLFTECHEPVLAHLVACYPFVDREFLHDAFVQALLELAACPERFAPARGGWQPLLWGAARRILRSLVRGDRRRRLREQKTAARVAREAPAARSLLDDLADRELAEAARRAVARTEEERQVLRLWELGIEDPHEYARALGREGNAVGLPERVKRVRDRLTARLRRLAAVLSQGGVKP